jgi:hypothetical protein
MAAGAKWMFRVGLAYATLGLLVFAAPVFAQNAAAPNMSGPPPDMSVVKRDKKGLREAMMDKVVPNRTARPSIIPDTHEPFKPPSGIGAARPQPHPSYRADVTNEPMAAAPQLRTKPQAQSTSDTPEFFQAPRGTGPARVQQHPTYKADAEK